MIESEANTTVSMYRNCLYTLLRIFAKLSHNYTTEEGKR